MRRLLPILALALFALLGAPSARAEEPAVQTRIDADVSAIQPGQPFHLAITVTPPPGWHIYWQNPGDSGLPTKVRWSLPPGYIAGPLQYPLPHQYTLPGDIIAYGYEGPTSFLATITPPKDLNPNQPAFIEGTVSWLCCKEECVPGSKPFSMAIPISTQATPANPSLFKDAQSRLPTDTPWAARQAALTPDLQKTSDGLSVTLHLGLPALPCQMFPLPTPTITLSHITCTPTPAGNDIHFQTHTLAGQKPPQHLPILIVYSQDHTAANATTDNRTGFYLNINLSGPAPAGHP
ncbi:MAG: protein-disulfide reductase DsbD domain-containing protein [Phycisphaerae bacterium]